MTLPHGFGSGYTGRCSWGGCDGYVSGKDRHCDNKECLNYQDRSINIPLGEKIRLWKREHDEAWFGFKLIGASIVILTTVLILAFGIIDFHESLGQPTRDIINGFNCHQLAEYVADKSPEYSYADHRYEWLCVNEQIKEFKG